MKIKNGFFPIVFYLHLRSHVQQAPGKMESKGMAISSNPYYVCRRRKPYRLCWAKIAGANRYGAWCAVLHALHHRYDTALAVCSDIG